MTIRRERIDELLKDDENPSENPERGGGSVPAPPP